MWGETADSVFSLGGLKARLSAPTEPESADHSWREGVKGVLTLLFSKRRLCFRRLMSKPWRCSSARCPLLPPITSVLLCNCLHLRCSKKAFAEESGPSPGPWILWQRMREAVGAAAKLHQHQHRLNEAISSKSLLVGESRAAAVDSSLFSPAETCRGTCRMRPFASGDVSDQSPIKRPGTRALLA